MTARAEPISYYFCTYFDHRYLPRGLTLYDSLKKHCPSFQLWVLCLDDECSKRLNALKLPEVHLVNLADLEAADPQLAECRKNRSLIEYYFTCTPSWLLYLFRNFPEPDVFTYLDADLFFFSNPAPVYEELEGKAIGIIAHRFAPEHKEFEKFGIYNVGWLSFRRDSNATECLIWWRDRCLEWCHDYPEEGRYADQKYLDDWPERFQDVVVLRNKGANVAPWNVLHSRFHEQEGILYVDSQPLIFYHFHLLKALAPYLFDPGLSDYGVKLNKHLKKIYVSYLRKLKQRIDSFDTPLSNLRYKTRDLKSALFNRRPLILLGPVCFELNLTPVTRVLRLLQRHP